jgi:hypothetical protein
MGFFSFVGGAIGTLVEPGGGTAVGAALGSALEGSDDGETKYCPGQASAAAILTMIAAATLAERTQLESHWRNTGSSHGALFSDSAKTQLRISASEYSRNVWGGDDCKLSADPGSAGNQQKSYVQSLLQKYASGFSAGSSIGETATAPADSSPSALDQAIDIAGDVLHDLPGRIVGSVIEQVGEGVRDISRPIVVERAEERFLRELPVLAIGVVLALLLFRRK